MPHQTAPSNGMNPVPMTWISNVLFYTGLIMIQSVWIAVKTGADINTAWTLVLIPTYVIVFRIVYHVIVYSFYNVVDMRLRYGLIATCSVPLAGLALIGCLITLVLSLDTDDTPIYIFWTFMSITSGTLFVGFLWVILEVFMGACNHGCRVGILSLSRPHEERSDESPFKTTSTLSDGYDLVPTMDDNGLA